MSKVCGTAAAVFLSLGIATTGFAPAAQAKIFKLLHTFAGAPSDADHPGGTLIFDRDGNLYGTTYYGGVSNKGAIFKIDTQGNESVVHSFDGSAGGSLPYAGLTLDPKTGDFYGITEDGGLTTCGSGCGTIFKLAANGTFTVLHAFAWSTDGNFPNGQLIRDRQGNLYGVTLQGGSFGYGTLFEYSKDGAFTVLHNFDTPSADSPTGRLARDDNGNLYGVTIGGGTGTKCGTGACGTIYEFGADGTFTILYSFQNGADGRGPNGGLTMDKKGNLYGTTAFGGSSDAGTVFVLTADRQFRTIFTFKDWNGQGPQDEVLLVKNDIYLTTYDGGGFGNLGAVIKVTPDGAGVLLHSFTGKDGAYPLGGLVEKNSVLYGTASLDGASRAGTVFRLKIKK